MDQHPQKLGQRLRKAIASFFVTLTIASPLIVGGSVAVTTAGVVTPAPVFAGAPTVVTESLPQKLKDIGDLIKASLYFAARVGVKNAVRAFLETVAYNTAVLIASGDERQEPLTFTAAIGEQLILASDAAIGEFLNTIAEDNGLVELNLCSLNSFDKLRINLILPTILTEEPRACTFTEFMGMDFEVTDSDGDGTIGLDDVGVGAAGIFSYSELIADIDAFFLAFADDPSSYVVLSAKFDDGDNALSSLLIAFDEAIGAEVTAKEEAVLERFPTTFKGITSPISNRVETDAEYIRAQVWAQAWANYEAELSMTGDPFADAVSVFARTLASKYIERIQTGFLDGLVDINDSLSGDVSTSGSSGGRRDAEESFKTFKTASFNAGGDLDILSEFASCPDQGASATNCVVDSAWALAIEEGMTLREAFEQGVIEEGFAFGVSDASGSAITSPEQGLALRNIQVLRAYNVVPVGWELAATYIRDFEDDRSYSIGEMVDAFDQCGEGDDYSPYCGLIDPDWVLKEPLVYCRYEGYGANLLVEDFVDTDGNSATPQEHLIARESSCLDPQTCIDEDDSGFCKSYGYCTEQYDIYRFQGSECPLQYTSCEGFKNSDGEEVSYLQNTLNFNDCSDNNDGCAWYCTVYNDVDDAFQCAGQNEIYTTCETDGGCTCTGSDGVDCTVSEEGFTCTTDPDGDGDTADGVDCTLGTESETGTELYSASFDADVQECSSDEEGCTEFVQVKGGNNILMNGDFESLSYGGTDYSEPGTVDTSVLEDYTDTSGTTGYGDYQFAFGKDTGVGCDSSSSGVHDCYGWELYNGAKSLVRAVDSPFGFTTVALQMQDGAGSTTEYIQHRFETEQDLADRSFVLSFYGRASVDDCTIDYWISDDDGTGSAAAQSSTIELDGAGLNTEFVTDPYTFDPGVTDTIVKVGFHMPNGCVATIDGVKLEENNGNSGPAQYQDSPIYLNINEANSCTADQVGCELYTPQTGESLTPITGIVTNPLSDACGEGEDYTDASCSQCTSATVGCDAFIEVASPYDAPLKDLTLFTSPSTVDADLQAAIADRTGYYCDNDFTACNSNADCSGSGQCLPSISVIPSTGTQCTADQVGCEEYVNIDDADAGGEGLEYYSFIQKCVKPTERQNDAGETETFFTWEGSDETGFQLRSWDLKVSTLATDENSDGTSAYGPCTNLDLWDYTGTAESAEAECIDDSLGVDTCTYGSDESCLEFRDADGNPFYRNVEDIIKVSDECVGLRNTKDDRLYYALESDSTSCNASANQCREYKGSQGSNVQILIEEDFETATFSEDGWDGGSASSETLTAGVSLVSMLIGTDTSLASGITSTAQYDIGEQLVEEDSYVVSFWAKADSATIDTLDVSLYSADGATTTTYFDEDGAEVTEDWKQYTLGPLAFAEGAYVTDETLRFDYNGSGVYIDYVELRRNDSHYLILDTAETCSGYEGCEEYQDSSNDTHYLKSFQSLCSEQDVGCEALVNTNESQNPYYDSYQTDNEYDEDDVYIPSDDVEFYAVVPEALCSTEEAGCMIAGLPDLDAYYDVESYEKTYLINDPDDYDSILCEQQSLYCDAYSTLDGNSTYYFKNPGDRTCEYSTSLGYWVISGTESDECPIQYGEVTDEGAQPKGPICNGGARAGQLCSHDDDCPAVDGDTDTYRCVSDYDDLSGWTGSCQDSYQGCTLYVDTNTRSTLDNADYETNVYDNDDYGAEDADSIPDDWEVLDEGESNASAGAVAGHTFTDITNGSISGSLSDDAFVTMFAIDESDLGVSSTSSYYAALSDGGSEVYLADVDDNPASSSTLMIALYAPGGFELSDDLNIVLSTTDSGTDSVIRVSIPSTLVNGLDNESALFYVAQNGQLYWADAEGDGLDAIYSSTTDTILSETEAFANDAVTSPTGTVVNGFYDAEGFTGTIGCDTLEQSEEFSFSNKYSMKVANTSGTNETCIVQSGERYDVDPDEWYTLRINAYTEDTDAEFAVGLHYYYYEEGIGYLELGSTETAEGYSFTAYEGGDRSDVDIPTSEWMHFHGTVGPNLKFEIPPAAEKVVPFVEVKNGTVYFDQMRLSENQKYSYLAGTVDGDAASNVNTCSGDVYEAGGCVAFRDATFTGSTGDTDITSLAYLSTIEDLEAANSEAEIESCLYNAEDDNERCSSYPNAADSNVVLKVRRDRGCAEWLTCKNSDPVYDDDGNILSDVCTNLARCNERNSETGLCTSTVSTLSKSLLSTTSDISVVSQPGNTDDIYKIGYLSGFSAAGIEWRGSETEDGACLYGAYDGLSSSDYDCDSPQETFGYYPYDWMVEQGSGSSSSQNSVTDGDFEDVYCTGDAIHRNLNDLGTSIDASLAPVIRNRDESLRCTADYHCRTNEADGAIETMLLTADSDDENSIETYNYHDGWCENVEDDGTWGNWSATSNARMMIIDYAFEKSYDTIGDFSTRFGYGDSTVGDNVGAGGIDLNNVLFVDPDNEQAAGIEYSPVSNVYPGQQYVLTFDAVYTEQESVNDFIAVGLQHSTDIGITSEDYFTTGIPIIDIVFIVDASGSMASYIENVADNISGFAEALVNGSVEEDEVDSTVVEETYRYRFGILTTADSAGPYPVDFDDFDQSLSTFAAAHFGGDDGVDEMFTEDTDLLTDVLDHIAANTYGGDEHNYAALQSLAEGALVNSDSDVNGYNIPYESASQKFAILLTDEVPDGDPYTLYDGVAGWQDDSEEETFQAELLSAMNSGHDYRLYSFLGDNAIEAYDSITESLGGGDYYDLEAEDYSEILEEIANLIAEAADPFRFSSDEYKSYALGPLTIENKADDADSTKLFIQQTSTSSGTNFVVDNISFKPVLEVNKENNPAQDHAPDLVVRECRGYAEDDSVQCNYSDTASGVVYTGWEGYCLVPDLWNKDRCVQWWPIDVISGSTNSFGNRQNEVEYNGASPIYHCLVAKGNEVSGACENTGAPCSSADQCNSSESCIGVDLNSLDDTSAVTSGSLQSNGATSRRFNYTHTVTASDYRITHTIPELYLGEEDDSGRRTKSDSHNDTVGPSKLRSPEEAGFWKFDGQEIYAEQNIHLSEIDNIRFSYGSPTYIDSGNGSGHRADNNNHDQEAWEFGKQTWNSKKLETEHSSEHGLWDAYSTEEEHESDFDETDFDTHPNDKFGVADADYEKSLHQVWQYGWWCDEDKWTTGICDENAAADPDSSTDYPNFYDAEFTIVKGITMTIDWKNIHNTGRVFNKGEPLNPFNHTGLAENDIDDWQGDELWNNGGDGLSGDNGTQGRIEQTTISTTYGPTVDKFTWPSTTSYDYFWSRYGINDLSSEKKCYQENNCGANIIGVNFDFEDGYLDAVYLFIWDGLRRVDALKLDDIKWEFELKEPCVFMVESVMNDATIDSGIIPWTTRVDNGSTFAIPEIGYTYNTDIDQSSDSFSHYGGVIPENNREPNQIDGDGYNHLGGEFYNYTALADYNLLQVNIANDSTEDNNVLPFACIGKCTQTYCRSVIDETQYHYYSSSDCVQIKEDEPKFPTYAGIYGLCQDSSGNNPASGAVLCGIESGASNGNNRCSDYNSGTTTYSCQELTSLDDNYTDDRGSTTWDEDLRAAVTEAWSRYRTVYAGLPSGARYYYAKQDSRYLPEHELTERTVGDYEEGTDALDWFEVGNSRSDVLLDSEGNEVTDDDGNTEYIGLVEQFGFMEACDDNERSSESEYCGVRPTVTDITLNGESDETVELNGPEVALLSFNLAADPDQEPVTQIRIIWESRWDPGDDETEPSFFEPDFTEECKDVECEYIDWNAEAESGITRDNLYSCDLNTHQANDGSVKLNSEGELACVYKIRIQAEDNWGWCSGNETGDGSLSTEDVRGQRGGSGECESYDVLEAEILVTE